jgi:hypothetical protein
MIGALYAPVPLKMRVSDGLSRPGSMFDVAVPRINNNTLIPFINQAAPYGTTQSILLLGSFMTKIGTRQRGSRRWQRRKACHIPKPALPTNRR